MKKPFAVWVVFAIGSFWLLSTPHHQARAADLFNLSSLFPWSGTDVHAHDCDECGSAHKAGGPCIERHQVQDCVVGKKKVYDSVIKYEYVSIPETRYRWKKKLIKKEIPCPYCKPVCKTEECQKCVGVEKWKKYCDSCGELHCKHIEPKFENIPSKHCEHKQGETTIKVRYWSCVKEPYTVYRQVKKPVCIKLPRYEKVNVPVTRYVCDHCDGRGCGQCGG